MDTLDPPKPTILAREKPTASSSTEDTEDSFDWMGDDRRNESEDDSSSDFFNESTGDLPSAAPLMKKAVWISERFIGFFLLILFIALISIIIISIALGDFIEFGYLTLNEWACLAILLIYFPIWMSSGLLRLSRNIGTSSTFSKTEIATKIEAIRFPLGFTVSSTIAFIYWWLFIPKHCPPNPSLLLFAIDSIEDSYCLLEYLQWILLFLIGCGASFTITTYLMISLRSSFEERSYKERIIMNRFGIYVVDQLYNAARETRISQRPGSRRTMMINSSANSRQSMIASDLIFNLPFLLFRQVGKIFSKFSFVNSYQSISSHSGRHADDQLTEDFAEFRRQMLKSIRTAGYKTIANQIPRSDYEAKAMARKIFKYLCPKARKYLVYADFHESIPNQAACNDAFQIFDKDNDGTITRSEFRNGIVKIFREQRNLAQSVTNSGTVLSVLDKILSGVVSLVLFLLFLSILGVNLSNIVGITISIVLGLNFIVFDAVNKTFHSLIFLFVVHPYDIGDYISIGDHAHFSKDEALVVVHIHIQHTIFRRWNGVYVTVPNHLLASSVLTNLSRSTEQWEQVEVTVECKAPQPNEDSNASKLSKLKKHVEKYLVDNSVWYYRQYELKAKIGADLCTADNNLKQITVILKIKCKETSDSQKKWARHSSLLVFLQQEAQLLNLNSIA